MSAPIMIGHKAASRAVRAIATASSAPIVAQPRPNRVPHGLATSVHRSTKSAPPWGAGQRWRLGRLAGAAAAGSALAAGGVLAVPEARCAPSGL